MTTIKVDDLVELVYHFPDRASKWLFDIPDNLRELLEIMDVAFVDRLDFSRMSSANIVRVLKDFRERSADRLFEIPFRFEEDAPREVLVHMLMENKSTPDPGVGAQMVCIQGAIFHQQLLACDLTAHRRGSEEAQEALTLMRDAEPDMTVREERTRMGKTFVEELEARGWEKGEQDGLAKGKRDGIFRILRHRFGEVPPAVIERVESLEDIARLDELIDQALDVQRPEEIAI